MADVTICAFGCSSVTGCQGNCGGTDNPSPSEEVGGGAPSFNTSGSTATNLAAEERCCPRGCERPLGDCVAYSTPAPGGMTAADYEAVGRRYMDAFEAIVATEPKFKDYAPAECPSELVTDLLGMLEDNLSPPVHGTARAPESPTPPVEGVRALATRLQRRVQRHDDIRAPESSEMTLELGEVRIILAALSRGEPGDQGGLYRPGVFKCDECGLRLISTAFVKGSGDAYSDTIRPRCPNLCFNANSIGTLRRVTWKEECQSAESALDTSPRDQERRDEDSARAVPLTAANCYAPAEGDVVTLRATIVAVGRTIWGPDGLRVHFEGTNPNSWVAVPKEVLTASSGTARPASLPPASSGGVGREEIVAVLNWMTEPGVRTLGEIADAIVALSQRPAPEFSGTEVYTHPDVVEDLIARAVPQQSEGES